MLGTQRVSHTLFEDGHIIFTEPSSFPFLGGEGVEAKVWGTDRKGGRLDLFPGLLCGRSLPSLLPVLALKFMLHLIRTKWCPLLNVL